jgi:hypothetical protein
MNKPVVADVGEAPEQVHRFDLRTGKFLPFWCSGTVPYKRMNRSPPWPAWALRTMRKFRLTHESPERDGTKYPVGSQFARLLEPPYSFTSPRTHVTVNWTGIEPQPG